MARRIGDLPGIFVLPLVLAIVIAGVFVANAFGAMTATKRKLPRDDVYYEITNDGGDHGNFVETFHVGFDGNRYRCIVYSDRIGEGGGGAGLWCENTTAR